ncbi:MAG: hypothetical protein VX346_22745 [Planctomycetota bacterium]|nr:hypothetical protein [Planctomycetota bacterium]
MTVAKSGGVHSETFFFGLQILCKTLYKVTSSGGISSLSLVRGGRTEMDVDAEPRWANEESAAAGQEPPSVASATDAPLEPTAPVEAVWGQRSLSVGSGCLFFFAGCVVCCVLLMVLLWASGTDPAETDATEEGGAEEAVGEVADGGAGLEHPAFAGGPPASSQSGSGPREGGLSYGGPTLKTLQEIALDELGRLDGKGRQNEAGEYVEVELRGGVFDNDLKQVAQLKSLQTLHLVDTHVSGEGCKSLGRLKALRELDLAGSPVTDRGLREVVRLVGLRRLDLRDTRVTFAGVLSLNRLPDLETLVLSPGQFSQRRLRGRLPGCQIVWQPREEE